MAMKNHVWLEGRWIPDPIVSNSEHRTTERGRVRKQPELVVYCVSDLMQVWKSRNSPSISHLWHHDPVWEAPTLLPWTTLFRSSEGTHTVFSIGIPQMRTNPFYPFFYPTWPRQKSWRYVINLQMGTIFHCHPRNDQPFPSGSFEKLPQVPLGRAPPVFIHWIGVEVDQLDLQAK